MPGAPGWVLPAYYAISGYLLLMGLAGFGLVLAASSRGQGGLGIVILMIGAGINTILGLGLLFRIEIIRGIANFVCGLQALFTILGIVGTVLALPLTGALGVVQLILQLIALLCYLMVIFLIGETDRTAPNI